MHDRMIIMQISSREFIASYVETILPYPLRYSKCMDTLPILKTIGKQIFVPTKRFLLIYSSSFETVEGR
jgi:hypothetical protein